MIKSSLGYNQRQIASLGVAKDLGDSVGFLTGYFCEILPLWAALFIGALQNLIGHGWLWLMITGRVPPLPLWAMCVLIFIATNGETYFNTAALVSCVQNFPKSRGPIVGILKGFAGLSGAILTQVYAIINSPDHASLISMIAVGPSMVVIALMFIIRPVKGHRQGRASDGASFTFVYSTCLVLAAYLMGVMLVEDLVDISHTAVIIFTVFLFIVLVVPICIPISVALTEEPRSSSLEEVLLPEHGKQEPVRTESDTDVIFSELEDEKSRVNSLTAAERKKRIAHLQAMLAQAAAEGAVRVKRRRGPRRGEDFTLLQALVKADFWLLFCPFLLASGSGLTVIDNLGQMSQSLGYANTHIFVSMISIWNFLGRIAGGYLSENVVRNYAYPRPVAMVVAQVVMAAGHFFIGMGWPGAMYVGTLLIGLGYGAHWAVVPASASELFGLKNFGALYNFFTLANPAGSLVFSGVIASGIYDHEAEKQAERRHHHLHPVSMFTGILGRKDPPKCEGSICFFVTSMIMSAFCIIAIFLSLFLVRRTKVVYANLYGKSRT